MKVCCGLESQLFCPSSLYHEIASLYHEIAVVLREIYETQFVLVAQNS